MRWMMAALMAVAGCGVSAPEPSWRMKIGDACDSDPIATCSPWGGGLCFDGACRQWCGLATNSPKSRCADGEREEHMPFDTNPDACICVPE